MDELECLTLRRGAIEAALLLAEASDAEDEERRLLAQLAEVNESLRKLAPQRDDPSRYR